MQEAIQRGISTWTGWHWWLRNAALSSAVMLAGAVLFLISVGVALFALTTPLWPVAVVFVYPAWRGYCIFVENMSAFERRFSSAPGQARLGTRKDLQNARLIGGKDRSQDIYCGCDGREKVYYSGPKHIMTIGPTRSGKDTRLLIPNLKHLRRSIVVIDPKGEDAAITARYRAKLGPVLIINPCGVLYKDCDKDDNWKQVDLDNPKKNPFWFMKSCGFNPLMDPAFRPSHQKFFGRASHAAEAMVRKEGENVSQHWVVRARALAAATMMYAKLTQTPEAIATMDDILEMLSAPLQSKTGPSLLKLAQLMHAHPHREMARLAGQFLRDKGNELGDVVSTLHGQISALNDKTFVADMAKHPSIDGKPFHFGMLKERIITVYIILPTDSFVSHAVWLRLLISNALNSLMKDERITEGSIRPLLMLNEIGNLGHLQPLETASSMGAGKDLTVWHIWQDVGQVIKTYREEGLDSFRGGAGVLNAFSPGNDTKTAQLLSERCGMKTAVIRGYSASPKDPTAMQKSDHPHGFPLLRPEEISAMPEGTLLSFIEPFSGPLKLQVPMFNPAGLDPNPYFKKHR
jgi:type IV secretion system protein VirD4